MDLKCAWHLTDPGSHNECVGGSVGMVYLVETAQGFDERSKVNSFLLVCVGIYVSLFEYILQQRIIDVIAILLSLPFGTCEIMERLNFIQAIPGTVLHTIA
jgi:hypothetical protein